MGGGTCIPAAEGRKGGRLSSWHTLESGNTQTEKGGNETDRLKTSGVEKRRLRYKNTYKPPTPTSPLQCCETQLSAHAANTFAPLKVDSLFKCCVCPTSHSSPLTCYYSHTQNLSLAHINIRLDRIGLHTDST